MVRFKFKGTNVTLRGTQDPKWGWVDAHGQQVFGSLIYCTGNLI